jgi:predicted transcriptional regulator
MSLPCEIAVRCALPAIRATIAKELIAKYDLKQADVAQLLGVSQPAISLYHRKIRGKAVNLDDDSEVKIMIGELARRLSERDLARAEFISDFCRICRKIRAKGLLCEMHKAFDPLIDIGKCGLCTSMELTRCA